jgi:hypothetical protein
MNNMCRVCDIVLTEDNWYKSLSKINCRICKKCDKIKGKKWKDANRERYNTNERNRRYENGGKSMVENKKCASYLGCHVAERVLSKVFKGIEVMPRSNPGYDFICNKGKKIDVKSGCIKQTNAANTMGWQFHIERNQIADYFLCLAFDNRDDLNPLHTWLLPAEKFNHLTSATISTNTVNKWGEYRMDINKVVECCDTLRRSDNK